MLKHLAEFAVSEGIAVELGGVWPDYRERKDLAEALRVLQDNQIILLNNDPAHPTVVLVQTATTVRMSR
jgi:hypothetical protein